MHRHRQDGDDGVDDRAGAAADAGDAPNKTLAAQLYQRVPRVLPGQRGRVLRLYYDYYQPEAYVPQTDTTSRRTRRSTTRSTGCATRRPSRCSTRRDVIIVASVSCIYGLGSPRSTYDRMLRLSRGEEHDRDELLLRKLSTSSTSATT
jgi:excinuclease ABC subunit B